MNGCNGRMTWPQRGVYFFMEHGEFRHRSDKVHRVVRVGTHALKAGSGTTLWGRLSQHKGVAKSGGGNHRASIFRLLVGCALKSQRCLACESWSLDVPADPTRKSFELPLEVQVSVVIGAMPFLWLPIDDDSGPHSLRGLIERNAIALLSNFGKPPIDPALANWLGAHCGHPKVVRSGLWNQNHVDESYDPAFLDVLESLILRTPEAS